MDYSRIPAHVGIIMDGNGRWAKEKGMIRLQGHNAGMAALREIVKKSSTLGVRYLTVYAFSTENWKRPQDEVGGIFKLLVVYVKSELDELNRNNVRVNILGDWSRLPEDAKASIRYALKTTENNTGLVFNIALNYGGRAELVRAVSILAEKCRNGELNPEDITEDSVSELLYTGGMPDPDLIIRTGGEYRLSNFLTWQSAYSEIYVTDIYWPDFTPQAYEEAIENYQNRDRRFGGIKC